MKAIVKVTGLMVLVGAASFALNAGSALAATPSPFEEVVPHIPFDPPVVPGPEVDFPDLCEVADCELSPIDPCVFLGTCGDAEDDDELVPLDPCFGGVCGDLTPIDPCIFTDTCADDDADSDDEDMVIDPTSTPTDEPTATPTDEPTATPTDEPTAGPTDEPTTSPTDPAPTVSPPPGNLPPAGNDGNIMDGVGNGVVLLAGISLGAMALGWVLFIASRRSAQPNR
jgi:hypothetical protein